MKNSIKLALIFVGIVVVVIVGAIAGYFVIEQNKTFYIYDLRFVEPVENVGGYIYTSDSVEYKFMQNQTVYMSSTQEDKFPIAVYVSTSNGSRDVVLSSSNPTVASVVYESSRCFVKYLREGEATITAKLGAVEDSFAVSVHSEPAEELTVYDVNYYGKYANYYPNKIICYADSNEYTYGYVAKDASGKEDVNNSYLRVMNSYNKDVFEKVYIDAVSKNLVLVAKDGLTRNVNETIAIQSFNQSSEGIKVVANYYVDVYIVAYTPKFIEMEVSTSPDFDDHIILLDREYVTDTEVEADPTLIENYLDYQEEIGRVLARGEKGISNLYLTEKADTLYVRFRKVFTNGDVVYLNQTDNNHLITCDAGYLTISANGLYYTLVLDDTYFSSPGKTFDIDVELTDGYDVENTFKIEYAEFNVANFNKFYSKNEETNEYNYIYWDERSHYDGEIYIDGKLVAVAGITD
ncbi:MAG: hypothetical protein IJ538_04275 [Clostridia bacterium]|nr:hypothetical protein [Clostridia bacterium]